MGGNTLQKADHGSQPTASTSNDIAQPVVEEQDDIYSQTNINSLVAQQTQLSNNQLPSSGPLTNNNITPASVEKATNSQDHTMKDLNESLRVLNSAREEKTKKEETSS